jgi:hypothetical protein
MKKTLLLFLAVILFIGNNSCKKSTDQNANTTSDLQTQKTDVKTFEIVNIISHKSLDDKYTGTFGSKAIDIIKTSDTTLTFFVPNVEAGDATLNFSLGSIKFNVSKTIEVPVTQFITTFTQNFDTRINQVNPSTPNETARIDSSKKYKQDALALFNSLTNEQKREAILFYEANKNIFQTAINNTFSRFDTTTVMARQSDCPRTNYKDFYGCTADNLATSANELKKVSKEFLTMTAMATGSAAVGWKTFALGPLAWGITAVGTVLPAGVAIHLFFAEVQPAYLEFQSSLTPFLKANWIFSKAFTLSVIEVFQDQVSTNLNLTPKFRTITENDGNVNQGSSLLISAMSSLKEYWNKLNKFFGTFPTFTNSESSTTLATNEISVSNISNSNVQYLGNVGQSLKFKSVTGTEQTFNYKLTVNKQGFTEEKVLIGKVLAANPCSTGTTTAPTLSGVQVECNATNGRITILVPFTANGLGALIGGGSGWCDPLNTCYPTRLYFLSPGATDYSIAYNGYNVTLKSGNSNSGVVEITLNASCQSGQTVAQALQATYPNYQWKVEMMNQCNQRSNQVSF